MKPFLRLIALVLLAASATSCSNVAYYLQSVRGQLDIWSRQRDIAVVVAHPETPEPLREKLAVALRVRNFASTELGLPENASYRSYANLERQYAVWNVFAAQEFAIEPKQWCFLFVGCVTYRGYFNREDADAFAAAVATQGFDVYVGGIPAYSLLGYAPDPVLNSFVNYPVPYFARLIFHELAHQVVYVRDDSEFNESFAVTVEQAGVERWLARYGSPDERLSYGVMRQRRDDFVNLIETYREKLDALFKARLGADVTRAQKTRLYAEMDADYHKLKAKWGGFAGYDRFFAEKPNNAVLASIAIYTKKVPAFQALLAREGGDLKRFYAAARELARKTKAERTAELESLMTQRTGSSAAAH